MCGPAGFVGTDGCRLTVAGTTISRRRRVPPSRLSSLLLLVLTDTTGYGPTSALAWNSNEAQTQIYSFQEFYTDAQYGPDFGYYSTGRILHKDGPADNGLEEAAGSQEWFNSYTTLPMSISPDFAHALCDRLVTMWHSMDRPQPVVLAEFGAGTGMLARDILRRIRDYHGDFYRAVARYVIAERSKALRAAQGHTAAEFVAEGKLEIVRADARQASLVREVLEKAIGHGKPTVGFVISNELLDEFDPVRLRLMWHAGKPPTPKSCTECGVYREAYVIHRVDATALQALLSPTVKDGASLPDGSIAPTSEAVTEAATAFSEFVWEGQSLHCGLLTTPAVRRAMLAVAEELTLSERALCAPMLVCCTPFLFAVSQALQFHFDALHPSRPQHSAEELLPLYRHHLQRTNSTIALSKERYRQVRRLASAKGADVEHALLVGGAPSVLPGRIHSDEVFLSLHPSRCAELRGYLRRNADRFAVASRIANGVNWIFGGEAGMTSMHIKLVVRPGEASFVEQTSRLLDEGFLVTFDYGADADALVWHSLTRPNHEGIHIMDARDHLAEDCTANSFLACPGLQDLTTSVDFTEVATAGRELGGWNVVAYGPIFLLELSFQDTTVELAPPGMPERLGHLIERTHGFTTEGVQAWYRKPESDPWASFKMLVQHRGNRGTGWHMGAMGDSWSPLSSMPRFFHPPSPCWSRDLTKPPLASFIIEAAHRSLVDQQLIHVERSSAPATAVATLRETPRMHAELLRQFQRVLVHPNEPLAKVLDAQHVEQQLAYADVHLAALLVDYWRLIQESDGDPEGASGVTERMEEVRSLARSRRLPEIYGEDVFERVFGDVRAVALNATGYNPRAPYVCLAHRALVHGRGFKDTEANSMPLPLDPTVGGEFSAKDVAPSVVRHTKPAPVHRTRRRQFRWRKRSFRRVAARIGSSAAVLP